MSTWNNLNINYKNKILKFKKKDISAGSHRIKYYLAWVLADAVNNASGFGFNGYDKNGNAKWDLVTNVRILDLEVIKEI